MSFEKILKKLEEMDNRLERIEKKFFSVKTEASLKKSKPTSTKKAVYKGISGGVKMLIDNGFFETPRSMRQVIDELKREGYFYPPQSVDSAIRKDFFGRKKVLSRIKDGKIWVYVIRK